MRCRKFPQVLLSLNGGVLDVGEVVKESLLSRFKRQNLMSSSSVLGEVAPNLFPKVSSFCFVQLIMTAPRTSIQKSCLINPEGKTTSPSNPIEFLKCTGCFKVMLLEPCPAGWPSPRRHLPGIENFKLNRLCPSDSKLLQLSPDRSRLPNRVPSFNRNPRWLGDPRFGGKAVSELFLRCLLEKCCMHVSLGFKAWLLV